MNKETDKNDNQIIGMTTIGFTEIKGISAEEHLGEERGDITYFFEKDVRGSFITISLSIIGNPSSLDARLQVFIGNELMGGSHIRKDLENMVIAESSVSIYLPPNYLGSFVGKSSGEINSFRLSVHRIYLNI